MRVDLSVIPMLLLMRLGSLHRPPIAIWLLRSRLMMMGPSFTVIGGNRPQTENDRRRRRREVAATD